MTLAPAFRAYFEAVDGTGDDMVGEACFRFWPLGEIVPVSEYHGLEPGVNVGLDRWFIFADHLIDSFHLAVRLAEDPVGGAPVAVANGIELSEFAPSFEAFLDLYLANEYNLLWIGPRIET